MDKTFFNSLGLLVLRVAAGSMMLFGHGLGKLQNYSQMVEKFPDPLGIGSQLSLISAIGAEFGCSLLVIFGVLTRFSAVPLVFTMLVAATIVHADDPWAKKEFAVIYLIPFLTLVFTGGGRFSVDALLCKKCCKKKSEDEE